VVCMEASPATISQSHLPHSPHLSQSLCPSSVDNPTKPAQITHTHTHTHTHTPAAPVAVIRRVPSVIRSSVVIAIRSSVVIPPPATSTADCTTIKPYNKLYPETHPYQNARETIYIVDIYIIYTQIYSYEKEYILYIHKYILTKKNLYIYIHVYIINAHTLILST
jgi:hypothetical protein